VKDTSFVLKKERRTFVQIVIHTEKKYSHALLSASELSVRCGAMNKKQKSNSYPLVNVEIIKKI